MSPLVHPTAIEVIADHRIRLWFDDGSEGEVQFGDDDFRGVFEPLHDPDYFAQVVVDDELGTICWPNGADIDPVTLHVLATRGRDGWAIATSRGDRSERDRHAADMHHLLDEVQQRSDLDEHAATQLAVEELHAARAERDSQGRSIE